MIADGLPRRDDAGPLIGALFSSNDWFEETLQVNTLHQNSRAVVASIRFLDNTPLSPMP
jgi:hypothetical protein